MRTIKTKLLDQALHACLERVQRERISSETALEDYPSLKEELRPRLEAALWLASRKGSLQARSGYLVHGRQRLVDSLRQARRNRLNLVWRRLQLVLNQRQVVQFVSILLLAAILLTGTSVTRAAEAAIPGDASYQLKVTLEQVRLSASLSEHTAARLQIAYTQRRLGEVESVILQGRYAHIPAASVDLERQINAALKLLEKVKQEDAQQSKSYALALKQTLSSQADALAGMAQIVPQGDRHGVEQSLRITQKGIQALQERFLQP